MSEVSGGVLVDMKKGVAVTDKQGGSGEQGRGQETDNRLWYWPNISRDDAEKKLSGLPDGSFLIRDSKMAGDFTLTVRYEGGGRCVRVYHENGRYGLAPGDMPFSSLEDLVQFYKTHSLASFNKRLDIYLKGAVCRSSETEVSQYGVFKELYDLSQHILKAQTRLSVLQQRHDELDKTVTVCRLMMPALEIVKQMYYDQIVLQASIDSGVLYEKEADPKGTIRQLSGTLHGVPDFSDLTEDGMELGDKDDPEKQCVRSLSQEEEKSLAVNTRLIAKRHCEIQDKLHTVRSHCDLHSVKDQDLQTELKLVEAKVMELEERREELTRQMMQMGVDEEFLTQVMEPQVATSEFDRSMWLVQCDRDQAVSKLEGLPHGAFLLRRKDKRHFPYVLSIVVVPTSGGPPTVQHCYVVRPHGRGYGFNAALAVFESIDQLVLRHRYVSLKHYFRNIDAPLSFPVGCQEMINRRSGHESPSTSISDGLYVNTAAMAGHVLESPDMELADDPMTGVNGKELVTSSREDLHRGDGVKDVESTTDTEAAALRELKSQSVGAADERPANVNGMESGKTTEGESPDSDDESDGVYVNVSEVITGRKVTSDGSGPRDETLTGELVEDPVKTSMQHKSDGVHSNVGTEVPCTDLRSRRKCGSLTLNLTNMGDKSDGATSAAAGSELRSQTTGVLDETSANVSEADNVSGAHAASAEVTSDKEFVSKETGIANVLQTCVKDDTEEVTPVGDKAQRSDESTNVGVQASTACLITDTETESLDVGVHDKVSTSANTADYATIAVLKEPYTKISDKTIAQTDHTSLHTNNEESETVTTTDKLQKDADASASDKVKVSQEVTSCKADTSTTHTKLSEVHSLSSSEKAKSIDYANEICTDANRPGLSKAGKQRSHHYSRTMEDVHLDHSDAEKPVTSRTDHEQHNSSDTGEQEELVKIHVPELVTFFEGISPSKESKTEAHTMVKRVAKLQEKRSPHKGPVNEGGHTKGSHVAFVGEEKPVPSVGAHTDPKTRHSETVDKLHHKENSSSVDTTQDLNTGVKTSDLTQTTDIQIARETVREDVQYSTETTDVEPVTEKPTPSEKVLDDACANVKTSGTEPDMLEGLCTGVETPKEMHSESGAAVLESVRHDHVTCKETLQEKHTDKMADLALLKSKDSSGFAVPEEHTSASEDVSGEGRSEAAAMQRVCTSSGTAGVEENRSDEDIADTDFTTEMKVAEKVYTDTPAPKRVTFCDEEKPIDVDGATDAELVPERQVQPTVNDTEAVRTETTVYKKVTFSDEDGPVESIAGADAIAENQVSSVAVTAEEHTDALQAMTAFDKDKSAEVKTNAETATERHALGAQTTEEDINNTTPQKITISEVRDGPVEGSKDASVPRAVCGSAALVTIAEEEKPGEEVTVGSSDCLDDLVAIKREKSLSRGRVHSSPDVIQTEVVVEESGGKCSDTLTPVFSAFDDDDDSDYIDV